jgi:hypothetical protein
MAQVLQHVDERGEQLALQEGWTSGGRARPADRQARRQPGDRVLLCAGCRSKEARYGFRDESAGDPEATRPRTLCFECFRVELARRQAIAARLARGWNAEEVRLPLEDTLRELTRRRRRAQIAARHALGA